MKSVKESVVINCPVDKVFDYTAKAKNWPIWQLMIVEAEPTSPEPMGIGSTYKGVVRLMGLSMKWKANVTEYKPNIKWSKNITSAGTYITELVTYEPAGEAVKFTIRYEVKASWFMKLFTPMMVNAMHQATIKSLAHLKKILEA
jgi:uncharacterized membrane protein